MNFYIFYIDGLPSFNLVIHTQFFNFVLLLIFFYILIFRKKQISNSLFINVFKNVYIFIYEVVYSSVGNNGIVFFPFLFFFWLFIFFFNLIGLFPFAFTIGSHFTITICFSLIFWIGALILLIESEGMVYFEHFFPETVNFYLATFISFIELLSFVFRAISLALRLFANLVAGHVLLHLFGALVISSLFWYSPFSIFYIFEAVILLGIFFGLFCFELVVSFVQSYIFLLLSCIYLQDTFNNYQKNYFYFSTAYLRSKNYKMFNEYYNSEKFASIFFDNYFSPQNIKYRFITSKNTYKKSENVYKYFRKENMINSELVENKNQYFLEVV